MFVLFVGLHLSLPLACIYIDINESESSKKGFLQEKYKEKHDDVKFAFISIKQLVICHWYFRILFLFLEIDANLDDDRVWQNRVDDIQSLVFLHQIPITSNLLKKKKKFVRGGSFPSLLFSLIFWKRKRKRKSASLCVASFTERKCNNQTSSSCPKLVGCFPRAVEPSSLFNFFD